MLSARIRWVRVQRPDHFSCGSGGSLLVESIADAIEGLDCIEFGVDASKLASDALDVAVDGSVVDIDVLVIGHIEQLVARFHDAGALRERLEDQEFGDGEAHVLTVPSDLVPSRVHHQAPAFERRRLRFFRTRTRLASLELLAPQDRSDSGDQQALRERLRNIVIRAHREARASSSSSSFDVRKITGTELNSRIRRNSSIPSRPGILISNTPRSGGLSASALSASIGSE